jgi:DNA-binding CsgD family transcriptional regulator
MGKLVKKGPSDMIPKDIGDMTLKELIFSPDVEVHKKDNILKMRKSTSSETVMLEIRSYDDAATVSQSRTYRDKPFSHMESTIAQMRAEGKTQAEVATILGTTQTNISKIERKMKGK